MERIWRRSGLLASCVVLAAGLCACEKEQRGGSPLDPDPGAYKGGPIADLSPETLATLADRAKRQEFYNVGGPK